jgi:hypothetical protein
LAVVQADGKKDLDQTMWPMPGSDAKDFFQAGTVSEFSAAKFGTAKWNDGSASDLHIYEVGASSENISFKVGNGPIVDVGGSGGAGGSDSAGAGGSAGAGVSGGASAAGNGNAGTSANASGSAGVGTSAGGSANVNGGTGGGVGNLAGAPSGAGVSSMPAAPSDDASCSCRVVVPSESHGEGWLALLGGLGWLRARRSRAWRRCRSEAAGKACCSV